MKVPRRFFARHRWIGGPRWHPCRRGLSKTAGV